MNQSDNKPLSRSSFIRRRHQELAKYLIDEMAIDPVLANALLTIHKPATLKDALDLFLVDEQGFANHFFIGHPDSEVDECRICERKANEHIAGDSKAIIDNQSEEVQQNKLFVSDNEEEIDSPKKACEICYIQVIEADMLRFRGQIHNICLQCIHNYLKEEIGNMRVQSLSCPHCNVTLPNDSIRQLVDLPTYNKYRQFLRNIQIQKNPNLRWCPNSKCSVVVSTNPKKKISKCPKCATMICNRCNREAHPKSSCEGAFRRQIKNWENAQDIQKCKKCHGLVSKIAGCNHMTCSFCHYQWCWLCGSEYSGAHFSPLNPFGCPGLQDRARDDWGKCKIVLLRIAILLLLIIGFPVMIPVAMVAVGPVMVVKVMHDSCYPEGRCKKALIVLSGSIIGLAINPIVWIGCIVYFIPKGVSRLCEWYRQRREEQQRINNFLRERLLNEQIFQQPGSQ